MSPGGSGRGSELYVAEEDILTRFSGGMEVQHRMTPKRGSWVSPIAVRCLGLSAHIYALLESADTLHRHQLWSLRASQNVEVLGAFSSLRSILLVHANDGT